MKEFIIKEKYQSFEPMQNKNHEEVCLLEVTKTKRPNPLLTELYYQEIKNRRIKRIATIDTEKKSD